MEKMLNVYAIQYWVFKVNWWNEVIVHYWVGNLRYNFSIWNENKNIIKWGIGMLKKFKGNFTLKYFQTDDLMINYLNLDEI